ncbi:hypothetical protein PVAND_008913 [Polypedilum vanderplanki]|uniref:Translocator protein n=1 Tax=Polypedilum vanderplanki TaxID=319348 RepID=A0A9J6CBP8_POLVA|nr:hypothetical protein PVAND_008913 [Polypedilum vanderplanki]
MPISSCFEKPAVQIATAILIPNLGGWISGIQTKKQIKGWYETLVLPKCRPPNWVFPIAWTSLYTTMGYASYIVWKQGHGFDGPAHFPLILYGAQLALNFAWTPIFFVKHELKWSFVEIIALTATAAATGISFYKIDKTAGLLFVPYLAWLSFASYLNHSIWKNNTPAIEDKKPEAVKEK